MIESMATKPTAIMTTDQLKGWRAQLGVSQGAAAILLGMSKRHYQNYEQGDWPVRKTVALACAAITLGVRA